MFVKYIFIPDIAVLLYTLCIIFLFCFATVLDTNDNMLFLLLLGEMNRDFRISLYYSVCNIYLPMYKLFQI